MSLKLMYITNNEEVAKIAENSGVDWIFIDLEINGKEERQGHLDTVISRHNLDDVRKIKNVLEKSELLVRVNPIYEGSKDEIDRVITDGADIVMLPFFKTDEEVKRFIQIVNGRSKTCLLLETPEAVDNVDDILNIDDIDFIHIGLNDLHLGYKKTFMFELLTDGTVKYLTEKIRSKNITFGFGGVAQPGKGQLRAEKILAEHYRFGSEMVILSRAFCDISKVDDLEIVNNMFKSGISELRDLEVFLKKQSTDYFDANEKIVKTVVEQIVNTILIK